MHNIKAKLVLTKIDKDVDQDLIQEIKEVFSSVNIETYSVSNKTKEGLDEVKGLFANEVSCVMGQTGVGKSSLINAIDPNYERERRERNNQRNANMARNPNVRAADLNHPENMNPQPQPQPGSGNQNINIQGENNINGL
jgi:ribosome small subunit-dependent GTPase A